MGYIQVSVNRTCNYYSCWGNVLIQTICNMEQRKLLLLTVYWNRVPVFTGTARISKF